MSSLPATTMTTRFVPRLPPATGIARWLTGEGSVDPVTGNRYLQIEVVTKAGKVIHDHEVEFLGGDGIALHRLDPETFEIITVLLRPSATEGWLCNCKDSLNRPERQGQCKHVRAVKAALAKLPL